MRAITTWRFAKSISATTSISGPQSTVCARTYAVYNSAHWRKSALAAISSALEHHDLE